MESRRDVLRMMFDSFHNARGKFHILEYKAPVEEQLEYFNFSRKITRSARKRIGKMNEEELEKYFNLLSNVELAIEEKKKILSLLATSDKIRAYRLLENYLKHPDEELKNWASMALMESQISIESDLTEERQIYISTGLGGKGDKLRFYVLMFSSSGDSFKPYQRNVIENEFDYYMSKNDCEIERLSIKDNYMEIVFLMPVLSNLQQILRFAIDECNMYGNFLSKIYTVTNVRELNQDEVNEILAQQKFRL